MKKIRAYTVIAGIRYYYPADSECVRLVAEKERAYQFDDFCKPTLEALGWTVEVIDEPEPTP